MVVTTVTCQRNTTWMINGVLLAKVTRIDWYSFMSSDLSILSIKVIEVVKASLLQYPFTFRWYFPLFERIYNLNLAWKISRIFKKYLGNEKTWFYQQVWFAEYYRLFTQVVLNILNFLNSYHPRKRFCSWIYI